MSNQVNITISKILNWSSSSQNIRLQIGFYSKSSGSYLAHKTVTAHNHNHALSINTSFNIHYPSQHQFIVTRISALQGQNQTQIGEIQIDLNLLREKQLLYIPFSNFQNVLEVKLYSAKPTLIPQFQEQSSSTNRHRFLQERNDFIDKLNDHESQLKKKFSEKVYNLLKDIKNRGSVQTKERERSKGSRNKNELDFRTRLSPQKKKSQSNKRDGMPELRNASPNKLKVQNQLLIHSMKSKPQTEEDHTQFTNQLMAFKQKTELNKKYADRFTQPVNRKTPFGGLLEEESRK